MEHPLDITSPQLTIFREVNWAPERWNGFFFFFTELFSAEEKKSDEIYSENKLQT